MARDAVVHDGGCLCGAVRYSARGAPTFVAHCHCSMCRRNSGAAFMTFAGFPRAALEVTGVLTAYRSSARGVRSFCGQCGSPVTFTYDAEPETVYLTLGTLDRPGAVTPAAHWYESERVDWLHVDDDLPRHAGEPDA